MEEGIHHADGWFFKPGLGGEVRIIIEKTSKDGSATTTVTRTDHVFTANEWASVIAAVRSDPVSDGYQFLEARKFHMGTDE